jgi:hypothetical protein
LRFEGGGSSHPPVSEGMDSPLTKGSYIDQQKTFCASQPREERQDQEKRRQTLLRRKSQEAKTFELKLDRSKISKSKLELLLRLFLEAKWFTNHVIVKGITSLESHRDYKLKTVPV